MWVGLGERRALARRPRWARAMDAMPADGLESEELSQSPAADALVPERAARPCGQLRPGAPCDLPQRPHPPLHAGACLGQTLRQACRRNRGPWLNAGPLHARHIAGRLRAVVLRGARHGHLATTPGTCSLQRRRLGFRGRFALPLGSTAVDSPCLLGHPLALADPRDGRRRDRVPGPCCLPEDPPVVGAAGERMQCGTLELRPWRSGGGIRAPQARWAHRGVRRLPRGRPVQRCSVVAFCGLNAAGRPAGWRGCGGHGHRLWRAHLVLGRVLRCHRPVCIVRR